MVAYSYSQVRKADENQEQKAFNCYRAVGLAVEPGHAFCREHGLGKLLRSEGLQALRCLNISGPTLEVMDGDRFRKVPRCQLTLYREDAAFAVQVVQQHRGILADLRLNIWQIDKRMKKGLGSFDAQVDFSTAKKNWGVEGLVWVEMKLVVETVNFEEKLKARREALETKLEKVNRAHPEVEAVMLLATRVQKDGGAWQKPVTLAQLFKLGGSHWQTLAGNAPKKVPRGRAKTKPPLQQLWDSLCSETVGGQKVFYVADLLSQLGLPSKSIKKREPALSAMIHPEVVFQEKIPGKGGKEPWLANRAAIRALYTAL